MNFLEQQVELASQLGLDQTQVDTATRLKRWLNMSQRAIVGAYPWPFLRAPNPLIVQTVPDYTTGTVTYSVGNTTITMSDVVATSRVNSYIQFNATNDWYRIVTHTAGTSTMTIDPAPVTSTTGDSFKIRKMFYSTSADVDRILGIKQWITPYRLTEISKELFDSMQPIFNTTGNPTQYMMRGKGSDGYWQFSVWPNPSTIMNLDIEYLVMVDDLVGNTEESIIPSKWNSTIMIEGAKMYGYNFLDDTRETETVTKFYKQLADMKDELMPSLSMHRRFRSVDQQPYISEFPYPSNYPGWI